MATTAKIYNFQLNPSSKTLAITLPGGVTIDRVTITGFKTLQVTTHGDQSAAPANHTLTLCADGDSIPSGQVVGVVDWSSNLNFPSPLVAVLS